MGWRSYNLRKIIKVSESLFDKKAKLRWRVRGPLIELYHDKKLAWDLGTGYWHGCHPTHHDMADFLLDYINTPVDRLRKREMKGMSRFSEKAWYGKQFNDRLKLLFQILLSADRRLGQEIQSQFMFVFSDRTARNLAVLRSY
jgi:hypothetical protein